uniref:Putative c1galt1-specific chaperone 1-like protein n=1 Tax=Panstrongylus lignarius TaxID=156445 RepID=A0A224XEH5_9HEMI
MNCVQTFAFLIGFTIGFFLIFTTYVNVDERAYNIKDDRPHRPLSHETLYKFWFTSNGFKSGPVTADEISFSPFKYELESEFLFDKVKITCILFITNPRNAYAVKHSWGKKCNSIHFYSKKHVPYIKVNRLNKSSSWQQLCDIIREIWSKEKVEWVLFAPDYVYVIPENLRYLVAYRDPDRSYYLGHTSHFWNQVYNSGETAYVLSRGTIRKIVSKFNSSLDCLKGGKYTNNEDYLLGKHLSEMGVRAEDTRDEMGRPRFHIFTPVQLMAPGSYGVLEKHSRRSIYPVAQVAENFIEETLGKGVNLSSVSSEMYYNLWTFKINTPEKFNEQIRKRANGHRMRQKKFRKETLVENHDFLKNISRLSDFINSTSH